MAQQVAGFGTSAAHLWVATECLALPSPAAENVVVQAVQVCLATVFVAAPARTWPPLAWRFTSVVSRSAHLGQAMVGAAAAAAVAEAFRSLSIWRTLGEAAMPSSLTGLSWALAAAVSARPAAAVAIIREMRFVFIFVYFFSIVSFVRRGVLATPLIRWRRESTLRLFLSKAHPFYCNREQGTGGTNGRDGTHGKNANLFKGLRCDC